MTSSCFFGQSNDADGSMHAIYTEKNQMRMIIINITGTTSCGTVYFPLHGMGKVVHDIEPWLLHNNDLAGIDVIEEKHTIVPQAHGAYFGWAVTSALLPPSDMLFRDHPTFVGKWGRQVDDTKHSKAPLVNPVVD